MSADAWLESVNGSIGKVFCKGLVVLHDNFRVRNAFRIHHEQSWEAQI